MFLLTSRASKM